MQMHHRKDLDLLGGNSINQGIWETSKATSPDTTLEMAIQRGVFFDSAARFFDGIQKSATKSRLYFFVVTRSLDEFSFGFRERAQARHPKCRRAAAITSSIGMS